MKLVQEWLRLLHILMAKLNRLPESVGLLSDFNKTIQLGAARQQCRE